MEERFPDEFVTWHHKTPIGVKVDEVFGMDTRSGKVWTELARQIYCEQGNNYRLIDHFENGAPFLEGYPGRISLTHTFHFFAVASLPKTPEVNLSSFSPRAALGIDAEPLDRLQALKVREKFLSEKELEMIPENDLTKNIIAWTAKEALFKAAMTPGIDFRNNISLLRLPVLSLNPTQTDPECIGDAKILIPLEELLKNSDKSTDNQDTLSEIPMKLFSYESYGCIVTIAISPKAAKFGK